MVDLTFSLHNEADYCFKYQYLGTSLCCIGHTWIFLHFMDGVAQGAVNL